MPKGSSPGPQVNISNKAHKSWKRDPSRPGREKRDESVEPATPTKNHRRLITAFTAGEMDTEASHQNGFGSPSHMPMEHCPVPSSWAGTKCASQHDCHIQAAAVVVHRPGRGGCFLQATIQVPKPALFMPNYSWKPVGSQPPRVLGAQSCRS